MPPSLQISTLHFKPYPSLSQSLSPCSHRGRIIVLTGGGRGIGLSIAHAFARAGAVALHLLGRTASTLAASKTDLEARHQGCRIYTHLADISNERAVNEAFENITRRSIEEAADGSGFVLVHAAAFFPTPQTLDGINQGDGQENREWWKTFETNVNGTLAVLQAFTNLLGAVIPNGKRGQHGSSNGIPEAATDDEPVIINLVSASAFAFTAPGISAYAASKLAAIRIMECAALEDVGRGHHVRIVNLHPGAVMTDMLKKVGGEDQDLGIPINDGKTPPLSHTHAESVPFLAVFPEEKRVFA